MFSGVKLGARGLSNRESTQDRGEQQGHSDLIWTVSVRRFCRTRADAFMKYCAVSSSRVCNNMVVLGAEDTSSLNPRPTFNSCGRDWSANRNAVFVPRAVCRICAKLL